MWPPLSCCKLYRAMQPESAQLRTAPIASLWSREERTARLSYGTSRWPIAANAPGPGQVCHVCRLQPRRAKTCLGQRGQDHQVVGCGGRPTAPYAWIPWLGQHRCLQPRQSHCSRGRQGRNREALGCGHWRNDWDAGGTYRQCIVGVL